MLQHVLLSVVIVQAKEQLLPEEHSRRAVVCLQCDKWPLARGTTVALPFLSRFFYTVIAD